MKGPTAGQLIDQAINRRPSDATGHKRLENSLSEQLRELGRQAIPRLANALNHGKNEAERKESLKVPSREHLRIRTGPIADASKQTKESRCELYRRAMDANDQLMIGRFCGVEQIDYEIGMAFPGRSVLFAEQLVQALQTAAAVAYSPRFTTS